MAKKNKGLISKTLIYLFLSFGALATLFPIYYMFVSATHSGSEVLSIPPKLFIGDQLLNNIKTLNRDYNVGRVFFNSLFVSSVYTFLTVFMCSFAGYAFAKFEFRFKKVIFVLIMMTMMIPQQVLMIPLFNLMNTIGWADTYQAIIVPGLANAFGIFLMRQNMESVLTEMLESGRIDGAGEFRIFFQLVLPTMKPALGALGIYMFMQSWGSFLWPLIILGTQKMFTMPIVMSAMNQVMGRIDYGAIMALASLTVLPIMLVFFRLQKMFIAGLTAGAVKG